MSSVRDYAILWVGAVRGGTGRGGSALGGNVLLTVPQHKIDGLEHLPGDADETRLDATVDRHGLLPTLSGDHLDAFRGDGTFAAVVAAEVAASDGGGFFAGTDLEAILQEFAGKALGYHAHGNTGSTETFDAATGWHSATLNANCAFTFTGATSGLAASMVLELAEDGTGGWTITLPASVLNRTDLEAAFDASALTTSLLMFFSRDGGTTWFGFIAGGGGSALEVLDEGVSLDTAVESIDVVGAGATATHTGHAITITVPGTPTGAAGGDLSGTYPNPSVVNDSHSHTSATLPAVTFPQLLISSTPGSPIVFADVILNSDGSDFLYSS